MNIQIRRLLSFFIFVVLLTVAIVPKYVDAVSIVVPSLEKIRVGLFISGRDLTPSVGLTPGAEMSVGYRTPAGVTQWFSTNGKIEVNLNQFSILAGTYAKWQDANTAAGKITFKDDVVREKIILERKNKTVTQYLLYVGQYSTQASAQEEVVGIAAKLGVASGNINYPKVIGQKYWSVGAFPTQAEADSQLAILVAAGVEAYKVFLETDNGAAIQVWIGPALNDAALAVIKTNVSKDFPSLQFTSIDLTKAYLIEKKRIIPNTSTNTTTSVSRYVLNANGAKLHLSSTSASKYISVTERYNRSYRGVFEITGYKNELAVINELPFEQYLYSVVSSEMGGSFPLQALKAQAVAARTYAIDKTMKYDTNQMKYIIDSNNKYGIAHLTDTVYEQAYKGAGTEHALCVQAVTETTGEVMMSGGKLAVPYYSSNMGGYSADNSEVWKGSEAYIKSVASPDQIAEQSKAIWYRVVTPTGKIGFIRSDLVTDTGKKTNSGLSIYTATTNGTNVRPAPTTNNTLAPAITTVNKGDSLIVVEQRREWNAYSWVTAPLSGAELQTVLNKKLTTVYASPITTLAVTKVGPSGRAVEVTANGKVLPVSYPDAYRSMLGSAWVTNTNTKVVSVTSGSLWSTRFEIDNTASYTILGADGKTVTYPNTSKALYALNASSPNPPLVIDSAFFAMNENDTPRYMTINPTFRFIGYGFGHGLGMSQWGAKDLAEFVGYNYKEILAYYFQTITIEKGTNT